MIRHDSRAPKELRKITIETNVFKTFLMTSV